MAVHFDVVLPDGGFRLPTGVVIEDLDDDALAGIDEFLGPAVDDLLPCFLARMTK